MPAGSPARWRWAAVEQQPLVMSPKTTRGRQFLHHRTGEAGGAPTHSLPLEACALASFERSPHSPGDLRHITEICNVSF